VTHKDVDCLVFALVLKGYVISRLQILWWVRISSLGGELRSPMIDCLEQFDGNSHIAHGQSEFFELFVQYRIHP
jgi:hypothetical protein